MYKRALVLMTALIPTKGHRDLIGFADNLGYEVDVIVSTRSFEPIEGTCRVEALRNAFAINSFITIYEHKDDLAPQNPSDLLGQEELFWDYWKYTINNLTSRSYDLVVASEPYGYKLAEVLGAKFMPYDLNREINPIKGTDVREKLPWSFNEVLPEFQKHLLTTATVFGAESCFKSSVTQRFYSHFRGMCHTLPEWARPYLESLNNPDVTPELMNDIMEGQYAMQMNAKYNFHDKPFIIQDTDLLSTIGYYRIMGIEEPEKIRKYFKQTKSDMYFLMASNVPFTPDPLRYGGDVRESTDQFWIDLLEEFECQYAIVDGETSIERYNTVKEILLSISFHDFTALREFKRD